MRITVEKDSTLLGPPVKYPTPWRRAEQRGSYHIIVSQEGCECFSVMDKELADSIILAVNTLAERGWNGDPFTLGDFLA